MPDTSNAERLWHIAEEIRGLPEAFKTFSNHRYEVALAGGSLLPEAIDLGAFAGPEYIKLRHLIRRQKEKTSQDWDWRAGVWDEAVTCLAGGTGGLNEWEPACGTMHVLIIARNVLDPTEVKYFVAWAPPGTSLPMLLLVAFSRWRVERCFEDSKGEIGLSHYEGRRYLGLKRHLILSTVSYLFLVEGKEALRGKKSAVDGVPSPRGDQCDHPILVA